MAGQFLEDMLACRLAGWQVAAFAKTEHHVEESEVVASVGDGVVLASDSADPDATKREDAGLHRCLADDFAGCGHIDTAVEIGRVLNGEMRHGGITPCHLCG